MTYTLRVETRDGESTVVASGDVPDGIHTIDGSDDGRNAYVAVTRRDSQGRYAVHAQHTHDREG